MNADSLYYQITTTCASLRQCEPDERCVIAREWYAISRATRFDGLLRTGRADLHAALIELAELMRSRENIMDDADDGTRELLAQISVMRSHSSPQPAGEPFEPENMEAWIAEEEWPTLLASAERELHALPDSPMASMGRALALLELGRHDEAAAEAERAGALFPSRHPWVLAAAARALSGDTEAALEAAFEGLRRRHALNYPETLRELMLPEIDEAFEDAVARSHQRVVQRLVDHLRIADAPRGRLRLFGGLLNPSLEGLYTWLRDAVDHLGPLTAREQAAVFVGLARGERWYCDLDEAEGWLARLPADAPDFAAAERGLLDRDRALLAAGEIVVEGHGLRFTLFRNATGTGTVWVTDQGTLRDETSVSGQIANAFRERAAEWIASGFAYTILRDGPLESDDTDADRDADDDDDTDTDDDDDDADDADDADDDDDDADDDDAASPLDIEATLEALEDGDGDALLALADQALADQPEHAVSLALKCLALTLLGDAESGIAFGERACALLRRRPTFAPWARALLAVDDREGAVRVAVEGLAHPTTSATPSLPFAGDGIQRVRADEGRVLDAIEDVVFQTVAEEERLLEALLLPNRGNSHEELLERFDELSPTEQATAALALARIARVADEPGDAASWLARAAAAGLAETVQAERAELQRDLAWVALGAADNATVVLTGFGLTLEVSRSNATIAIAFIRGDAHEYRGTMYAADDQAMGEEFRRQIRAWMAMGFAPA